MFILMLNPGLSYGDYFAEHHVEPFRQALIRNLRQDNEDDEYPFMFLNPQFAWHPGFTYWQRKVHGVVNALANRAETTYQQALSRVARSLACLELVPYHSRCFGASSLPRLLPSANAMVEYVEDVLIPRAKKGDVTIVATRSRDNWKLPEHENIVIYEGAETRAAHLTLDSRGGKAIARQLGL